MIDSKKAVLAPDFSFKDSAGRMIRLSDYRNKKNIFLVFNRGFS
jgi:peroxiredoxin